MERRYPSSVLGVRKGVTAEFSPASLDLVRSDHSADYRTSLPCSVPILCVEHPTTLPFPLFSIAGIAGVGCSASPLPVSLMATEERKAV